MNKNSRITLTALLMLVTGHTAAAPAAVSATVVPLANGGKRVSLSVTLTPICLPWPETA